MPKYSVGGYEDLSATEMLDKMQAKGERIKTTGKILRYLRKKEGATQREIASKLKIVQQTYAGYENGHHEPTLDILIQLADHYGVTLDYISGRIFDDWKLFDPFSQMDEYGECHVDLLNHAQRQCEDFKRFSDMTMSARMHGRYDNK